MAFNWKLTLFSLVFFSLFVYLGLWQLEREAEKKVLIAQDQARRYSAAVEAIELADMESVLSGQPVALSGQFVPTKMFLRDNVVLDGVVGFEVLVPFIDDQGQRFLVNRGFVKMARTRAIMPDIPPLSASKHITGHLYRVPSDGYSLGNVTQRDNSWPRIVQTSDPGLLQPVLGVSLYPYLVRLIETDPNSLPRYWPTTVMLPEKHRGYAIQWFTMALAILIAFGFFSFGRKDD